MIHVGNSIYRSTAITESDQLFGGLVGVALIGLVKHSKYFSLHTVVFLSCHNNLILLPLQSGPKVPSGQQTSYNEKH